MMAWEHCPHQHNAFSKEEEIKVAVRLVDMMTNMLMVFPFKTVYLQKIYHTRHKSQKE